MTLIDQTPTTILSLETWRALMGISPFRFWGLDDGLSRTMGCDEIVRQYAWQDSDAASRADILQAIAQAEEMLTDELNYAPGPRYVETTVPYPRFSDHRFTRYAPVGGDGRRLGVTVEGLGYIQALGVETITLLDTATVAGGKLTYSDADGDGRIDTWTITLTVAAGTDPGQIAVYVAEADRFDGSGRSERWRIRPIRASVDGAGTTLTVIGRSWTAVQPIRYEGLPTAAPSGGGAPAGLDPAVLANYCQELEVCTRVTDPNGETLTTAQGILRYNTPPAWLWGWCGEPPAFPGSNVLDPAAVAQVVARVGIRDATRGIVLPAAAVRNATTGVWAESFPAWLPPDAVTIRAYAGYTGPFANELERATALLAAALAPAPICACADATKKVYRAQYDLTLAGNQVEAYNTSDPDIAGPFGPRRGAVDAWKIVKRLAQTRASLMG